MWHPELITFFLIKKNQAADERNARAKITWNVYRNIQHQKCYQFPRKSHQFHPCLSLTENLFNPILKKKNVIHTYLSLWNLITVYTIAFFFYKIKIHVHVGLQKSN